MSTQSTKYWGLILGGSSGIGLATAKKLGAEGYNICIIHRDMRSRLKDAEAGFEEIRSSGVKVATFNADASNPDTLDQLIEQVSQEIGHGELRVLVHAISKGNLKSLLPKNDTDEGGHNFENDLANKFHEIDLILKEQQQQVGMVNDMDIQITNHAMSTSLIHWCRKLIEKKLFASGGRVIALTSEGNKRIWHSYVTIAMAKSSLEILVKYLARELAQYDITANVVQAGITDTPSLRMIPGYEVIMASTVNRNPYKRLTQPEDVANFIYLLCQKEASWVNGAVIPVDGGEHFC